MKHWTVCPPAGSPLPQRARCVWGMCTICFGTQYIKLRSAKLRVQRQRFNKRKPCIVTWWIKIAHEPETHSHFLPRNIVIFMSHLDQLCQLSECLLSWQVISQLLGYWWYCWTRDVSLPCALGAVSLFMEPKKRLRFSAIPLIYPEGEWLLPRGVLELKAWEFTSLSSFRASD